MYKYSEKLFCNIIIVSYKQSCQITISCWLQVTEIYLLFSVTKLCLTLCDLKDYSMPSFSILHYLLDFVHWVMMISNHLLLCHPPLPLIFPTIRVFSNELALYIRWSKHWSFSFSNEYSGLISLKTDWFYLLAVQRTLRSLYQYHNLKTSVLWHSAFFMSYSHIHTWLLEKPQLWLCRPLPSRWCLSFLICCLGLQ